MSRIGKGVMHVTLNDTEYTLKATVFAIEQIEARFEGGMMAAAQACIKLSFSDAVFIVAKAARLDKPATKQLKENVLFEGIEAVSTIAAEYIAMLLDPEGKSDRSGGGDEVESGED